jgi:hypothetical protein
MKTKVPFFDFQFPVHFEHDEHRAICGSGYLQGSTDLKNVTCAKCRELVRELKPICPRCCSPMVKTYIECDDHSGWMCTFTCSCYRPDEEAFAAEHKS